MRPPRGGGSMRGRGSGRGGKGKGGGKGGGKGYDMGPPDRVVEIGLFMFPSESELLCKSLSDKIPYFNAPIYLENKQKIGKVEEVLGPITEVYFTVKPDAGIEASSFAAESKFYIDPAKLLPASRFLPSALASGPRPGGKGKGGKGKGKGGKGKGKGKGGKGKGSKGKGMGKGKGGSRGRGRG